MIGRIMDEGVLTPTSRQSCPRTIKIDHVVPLSRGGSNALDNLVPCCTSCNSSKGARLVADMGIVET